MLLTLFGLGMLTIGSLAVIRPVAFAQAIITFSEKPWFHVFEIISRLIIGLLFLYFAEQATYPMVFTFIGILLCFVSVLLLVMGEKRHKQFALLTARIDKHFRVLGMVAVLLGMVLTYIGLS